MHGGGSTVVPKQKLERMTKMGYYLFAALLLWVGLGWLSVGMLYLKEDMFSPNDGWGHAGVILSLATTLICGAVIGPIGFLISLLLKG